MELCRIQKDVPSAARPYRLGRILELTGTTPERLPNVDIGWLKPTRTAEAALVRQDDVYRILARAAVQRFRTAHARRLHSNGPADRIATLELHS